MDTIQEPQAQFNPTTQPTPPIQDASKPQLNNQEVTPVIVKKSSYKKLLFFSLLIILTLISVLLGAFFYYYLKPNNNLPIKKDLPVINKPTEVKKTPSKTYSNNNFTFNYPDTFIASGSTISDQNLSITITLLDKEVPYPNCIQQTEGKLIYEVFVEKYKTISDQVGCENEDVNKIQYLVIPTPNLSSPGILFTFMVKDEKQANVIFDQIISTFKFKE